MLDAAHDVCDDAAMTETEIRTSKLTLGQKLALPVDAVTRTTAIVGQRGTGKTSTAVVMVEEASKAGAQFAVIDPTGAWFGLRSSGDGKRAGLDVIVFGGDHADLPLEAGSGDFLARLVVEQSINVVLDLSLLTKGKQVQFVSDFATTLYHLNRTALTLVIDEAHRFAPQQLRDPGGFGAKCLGAVTDVVALGRRKGLGAVLVSQRPATINKDVFEQAEIMIAHRLMGPNDRKSIMGWLADADPDALNRVSHMTLNKLVRGEALVFAPTFDVLGRYTIRAKRTFDSSATPEIGAINVEPRGRANVDLDAIREAMRETFEQIEANDPDVLRKRIRELESRPPETRVEFVETIPDDLRVALTAMVDAFRELERLIDHVERTADDRDAPVSGYARATIPASGWVPEGGSILVDPGTFPTPTRVVGRAVSNGKPGEVLKVELGDLKSEPRLVVKAGARRMLTALAAFDPMPMTRAQIATHAKVKKTGGTFSTYLGVLKAAGYLTEQDGKLRMADAGFEFLGGRPDAPATPDELLAMWRDRLKAGARRMLDALVQHYPTRLTRGELAEIAEVSNTGGTFSTYLGMLRSAGLISEDGPYVRASDTLFMGVPTG